MQLYGRRLHWRWHIHLNYSIARFSPRFGLYMGLARLLENGVSFGLCMGLARLLENSGLLTAFDADIVLPSRETS